MLKISIYLPSYLLYINSNNYRLRDVKIYINYNNYQQMLFRSLNFGKILVQINTCLKTKLIFSILYLSYMLKLNNSIVNYIINFPPYF